MKVAVIGGGTSLEASVSKDSAEQVIAGLRRNHDTHYIEFDRKLPANLTELDPDVVFPVLHGSPGEDGTIQGFLEILGYPFVGSGMTASALAIDKFQAKCLWREHDIPVLSMMRLEKQSWDEKRCTELRERLGDAIVIKPCTEGSALGVHLLPSGGDISATIAESFKSHDRLVVEPYIEGREITVGILERTGGDTTALPIIEIQVKGEGQWYDFTNRYKPGATRHVIQPDLPTAVADSLQDHAVEAHRLLGCRDLSRADFILDGSENIWLLEINTMPGMTPTSLYPDAARAAGIEFQDLMNLLVNNALQRSC